MARSFSNVKQVSALFADGVSFALNRRGYAVASQGASTTVKGGVTIMSNVVAKKQTGESGTSSSSWVPDPKTGHYRPENRADESDVAELRQMLLKQRSDF